LRISLSPTKTVAPSTERTGATSYRLFRFSGEDELNVYSNKNKGKKAECKAIAALIDSELARLGFTRTMLNPIPNMDSATIYRMIGRYTAKVSKENVIYRR
jgi:hypothetical protein